MPNLVGYPQVSTAQRAEHRQAKLCSEPLGASQRYKLHRASGRSYAENCREERVNGNRKCSQTNHLAHGQQKRWASRTPSGLALKDIFSSSFGCVITNWLQNHSTAHLRLSQVSSEADSAKGRSRDHKAFPATTSFIFLPVCNS